MGSMGSMNIVSSTPTLHGIPCMCSWSVSTDGAHKEILISYGRTECSNWRAGASLPSRPNGAIFLYIYLYIYLYISGVDVCRNVLRNSK